MNGVLGQFGKPEAVVAAAARARGAGPWRVEAYTPFHVEGLAEQVEPGREWLPALVFMGGLSGGAGGLALQYWASVVSYPLNVGGRPLASWPSWIPVCFELTILGAALTAVLGLVALSGLPRPHHPLFEVPAFKRATRDKFFVLLAPAPGFDAERARRALRDAGAEEVFDVP